MLAPMQVAWHACHHARMPLLHTANHRHETNTTSNMRLKVAFAHAGRATGVWADMESPRFTLEPSHEGAKWAQLGQEDEGPCIKTGVRSYMIPHMALVSATSCCLTRVPAAEQDSQSNLHAWLTRWGFLQAFVLVHPHHRAAVHGCERHTPHVHVGAMMVPQQHLTQSNPTPCLPFPSLCSHCLDVPGPNTPSST